MKFAVFAFALVITAPRAYATDVATSVECWGITWTQHCKNDKCDGLPPLPQQPFGKAELKRTDGSGWVAGSGEVDKAFSLSGQEMDLVAVGSYSMNKDGSVYQPGVALSFRSKATGITVSTNGPVSGTSASLNASVDSPRSADGSFTHAFADVFCTLH